MSSSNASPLETDLRQIRDSLKRQDLRDDLADAAATLETILLLQHLDRELYAGDPELDESLHSTIRQVRDRINDGDLNTLASAVEELQNELASEHQQTRQQLRAHVDNDLNKISAMQRLNDRVDKVDKSRITALRQQLAGCLNLDFVSAESLQVKLGEVEREADAIAEELHDLQQDVFGQFYGTPLEESINQLLDDETLRIDSLSMDEIKQLRDSDLADCLELLLS